MQSGVEACTFDALIERLWPDEKISWDAATARVYPVSTLRRAGLRGIQRRSAYLLDEEITIARRWAAG